ncbi:hypothetical protein I7I53_02115 [Histoplasma capsulatum var. duboisii H88]|uniref:Uncharacterized protein n=1 Tax=Ajellomyces capsulatus (strain H88) TaxID=544711 RepID=A0A8A1LL14_AJEC8|nr:hypothetical protein I7I53_02115 [Histoplasma capsulatum var. duboisii H88]
MAHVQLPDRDSRSASFRCPGSFSRRPYSVLLFVAHSMKDNCQMPWEETWGKTLYILDIDHWESPTTMNCCGGMHSIHAAKYVVINRAFIRCKNLMRVWQIASRIFNCYMPSTRSGPKFSL